MSKPLILIDGSSYFYRAFHALPPLKNSKGQPTGAIYGVISMIKRLLKTYEPEHIAVIFDAKGKTFRDDWYPEYKATRSPTPDDLTIQFQPLEQFLRAMGLPLLSIPGVEADDVIGTLAVQASAIGLPVLISTGDKDMAQLVNDQVTLINTMSDQVLDIPGVKAKFGVRPDQIIDYLTLVGDTSDNIPGVTKCGPKTAVTWLGKYDTLDAIMANADQFSGKIGEYLRLSLAHLPLSKRLITLKTDVVLPLGPQDLKLQPPNEVEIQHLAKDLEFKNWIHPLPLTQAPLPETQKKVAEPDQPFILITSEAAWQAYLKTLQQTSLLCFEAETTHPDPMQADLVGLALYHAEKDPVYIPFIHTEQTAQLNLEKILSDLKPIFENKDIAKLSQNLKKNELMLKRYHIHLAGCLYDTMLESYLLNSAARRHDLESLAEKYLNYLLTPFKDIAGSGAKQLRFDQLSLATAARFATDNIRTTLEVHKVLYPLLTSKLKEVYHQIEMPLLPILTAIESHGVLIDSHRLALHGERLKARLLELEQQATLLAGKTFNLNSPKQLQSILYEDLNIPIRAKTPTGQPSTAESALQELALDFELPKIILDYRSLSKLVSTYIDALPKKINPTTGRVHTSYNQAVTATGRLSSSDPNLQNIPIRTEEGRLIRKAFIAPPKHLLISADYSQIELRIMAHLSQDPQLIKAFSAGLDIHTATASEVTGIPLEAITSEMRRQAKAINFGLIYGMSAFGLSKQLKIDRQKAQDYINSYFARYPGVRDYMNRTRTLAHEQGYVETLFGRRLDLPDINAGSVLQRKAAERAAINAPLQGTAADLIKKTMIALYAWQMQNPSPHARMIMQVHDELVFEVHEDAVQKVVPTIKKMMESIVDLSVPLVVTIGVGPSWDDTH